jgi:hypothetical protein
VQLVTIFSLGDSPEITSLLKAARVGSLQLMRGTLLCCLSEANAVAGAAASADAVVTEAVQLACDGLRKQLQQGVEMLEDFVRGEEPEDWMPSAIDPGDAALVDELDTILRVAQGKNEGELLARDELFDGVVHMLEVATEACNNLEVDPDDTMSPEVCASFKVEYHRYVSACAASYGAARDALAGNSA